MTKWSSIQLQTWSSRELKKIWIRKLFYLLEDFLERRSKFIIIVKYIITSLQDVKSSRN